jgi:hypothetical protein
MRGLQPELLQKVKSPLLIVSLPLLGSIVPLMVVPLVVLTVPFPVNVPEPFTTTLAAVTVPPLVTVNRPVPGVVLEVPPTSSSPPNVH